MNPTLLCWKKYSQQKTNVRLKGRSWAKNNSFIFWYRKSCDAFYLNKSSLLVKFRSFAFPDALAEFFSDPGTSSALLICLIQIDFKM